MHNLLLVDFPCGKSSDTSNVGCFFSIISLITSQQNHAQTRYMQAMKKTLLLLIFVISTICCKQEKKEVISLKKGELSIKEIPNEVTITVNDTVYSKALNIFFNEFQPLVGVLKIEKYENRRYIKLQLEEGL